MGDFQDWNGDGKVTPDERAFTMFMLNDMSKKKGGGNGGGCLTSVALVMMVPVIGIIGAILRIC